MRYFDESLQEKEVLCFVCLPTLPLVSSSTLLLRYPLTGIRTDFFGIAMQIKDQLRHSAFWAEQLLYYQPFHQKVAIVGLAGPYLIGHSNKSNR